MTKTKPDTLGDRLRLARMIAGHEQADLAERLGVHRATISAAEHGRHAMKAETLIAWANACDVSLDWLAWGNDGRDRRWGPAA